MKGEVKGSIVPGECLHDYHTQGRVLQELCDNAKLEHPQRMPWGLSGSACTPQLVPYAASVSMLSKQSITFHCEEVRREASDAIRTSSEVLLYTVYYARMARMLDATTALWRYAMLTMK